MTRTAVAWLLVTLGAVLLAAGLILGFSSVKRMGVDCGSALGGYDSTAATVADYTRAYEGAGGELSAVEDACSAAVSDRKPIAWALVVPGGVLLLAALVTFGSAGDTKTATPNIDPQG